MYLTSERLALANQAVLETFGNTCIAWQAIPHWDTGDPAQSRVPSDDVNAATATVISVDSQSIPFNVTLALAAAAPVDSFLSVVVDKTVDLAAAVDKAVIPALRVISTPQQALNTGTTQDIADSLIDARATIESAGYRAPSCVITNKDAMKKLTQLVGAYSLLDSLLTVGNINSVHRTEDINKTVPASPPNKGFMIGRRQLIPHGGAAEASPGEEPADLAVSVYPSLEVVGESGVNNLALTIRVRYALRVKDRLGIVALI